MKFTKAHFDAGSPFSSWLKEQIIGEIANYKNGFENRGLIEKYDIHLFDGIDLFIMDYISKFDDYNEPMRNMAVEIIRAELDPNFEA